ncbi:MAG: Excinuclease ABC C subunit protein [uncultured bacterium]|nr:MAG: Excinuclease ABC C subunit protein [uncultured bacterium]OGT24038.1 MAG: excinuclease ABC subunit C [Gammaproteobacteria bacterium RIFCSPHIGHO2_12_38_15]OGT75228.1 MAG: excinuclease ABC subunit C [Gammaproteobacteria bacterium RIFCSPLOWO2_12_FULL_38_14]
MYYVYSLQSISSPNRFYIGLTQNLKRRFEEHNAGKSIHTNKHIPWKLVVYLAFSEKQKSERFERYLKTGSGRAFAKKYF